MNIKCHKCGVENSGEVAICVWCKSDLSLQTVENLPPSDVVEIKKPKRERKVSARKVTGYLSKTILIITILICATWLVANNTGASTKIASFKRANANLLSSLNPQPCKINGIVYSQDYSYIVVGNEIYCLNESICSGKIINISKDEVRIQGQEQEGVFRVGHMIQFVEDGKNGEKFHF
ncbi:MAG: hypothetical protein PVI33_06075 [Candidatus Omnitrophota bacterium]|jgi:hypothetical protein